jgi:N-methylhydantoinase A
MSDVTLHASRTLMFEATSGNRNRVASAFLAMEREARRLLKLEGFDEPRQRHERFLSLRYKGQSFELEIPFNDRSDVALDFHRAHQKRYGYSQKENVVELVAARLRSRGLVDSGKASERRERRKAVPVKAYKKAPVLFAEEEMLTAVYRREDIPFGARLRSPCVITEYSSTTLVPPGAQAALDHHGNILIQTGV